MQVFLISFRHVRMKVFVVYYSLAEAKGDNILDNVDVVVVCYFGTDIESINIVHVFLDSTCCLISLNW